MFIISYTPHLILCCSFLESFVGGPAGCDGVFGGCGNRLIRNFGKGVLTKRKTTTEVERDGSRRAVTKLNELCNSKDSLLNVHVGQEED